MPDSAFALAAMRATGTRTLSQRDRADAHGAAGLLGRRVVDLAAAGAATTVTLGFADGYEPNPADGIFDVRELTPIPLIALATCLGLCWADRDERPYPGRAVALADVLRVAGGLGAGTPHLLGALRNELTMAGLVVIHAGSVSVGPAVAAWTDAQIDALRRFAVLLPGSDD